MRRNARINNQHDDYEVSSTGNSLFNDSETTEDFLQMNIITQSPAAYNKNTYRFENTIEVKVETGDTLQAIALRFHCAVADIKRLNKIDKENEIHARNVVKIPVTVHNVLLDNLPIVHKSGNNSPQPEDKFDGSRNSRTSFSTIMRSPLDDSEAMLSEKLMVASVNSSGADIPSKSTAKSASAADMLYSKLKISTVNKNADEDISNNYNDMSEPLTSDILDDLTSVPQMHRIKGPSFRAIDWSGSDCDMSWICLFVVVLALCFVIPLVYVFYIAEHSHHS